MAGTIGRGVFGKAKQNGIPVTSIKGHGSGSSHKNNYHKAGGPTMRDAINDNFDDEVSKEHNKIYKMEVWERGAYLAQLIVKSEKDEGAKDLVTALVRSGRWYPEIEDAMLRVPRVRLTSRIK